MTGIMQQLADGNTQVAIPEQHRHDEIGRWPSAIQVFKTNMSQDRPDWSPNRRPSTP